MRGDLSAMASANDWLQTGASLVTAIGVPSALVYAARQAHAVQQQLRLQTQEQRRSTRAQHAALDMRLLERMLDMDRFFIEHPHLRAHMQGGLEVPETEPLKTQVHGSAEMMIDFADLVAAAGRHDQISQSDYESWGDFLQWYFRLSPAIRENWRRIGPMYPRGTRELLVPPELRGATADHDGRDLTG
jgi:hypothetical protein